MHNIKVTIDIIPHFKNNLRLHDISISRNLYPNKVINK